MTATKDQKRAKIKTSILIAPEIHARMGKRVAINKERWEGPTAYGSLIEVALKQYLDAQDELDSYRSTSPSVSEGGYRPFGE
jgi:hypothetical protein